MESFYRIDDFGGVARDAHPAKLPPHLFQADEGSDLFERGTWKVRRGRSRLPIAAMAGQIETIVAFQTVAGSIALVLIDSLGVFRGYAQLAADGLPPAEVDLEGYGVGGEGEGGFGV